MSLLVRVFVSVTSSLHRNGFHISFTVFGLDRPVKYVHSVSSFLSRIEIRVFRLQLIVSRRNYLRLLSLRNRGFYGVGPSRVSHLIFFELTQLCTFCCQESVGSVLKDRTGRHSLLMQTLSWKCKFFFFS